MFRIGNSPAPQQRQECAAELPNRQGREDYQAVLQRTGHII
jgi:hypothetical protein